MIWRTIPDFRTSGSLDRANELTQNPSLPPPIEGPTYTSSVSQINHPLHSDDPTHSPPLHVNTTLCFIEIHGR